jgi:hypothetical protein
MDDQDDADMEQRLINEGMSGFTTLLAFTDAFQSTRLGKKIVLFCMT